MKLFSLRLTTLKSKLYAIVFASFVVRVVAFFALPNTPSSFGPDEGTYARIVKWTALGKPATEFPDFGAGLYVSGRTLFVPSSLFNIIGLNSLDAVRLTASLYGFLLIILIARITIRMYEKNTNFTEILNQNQKIFYCLFLIFTFLPSHFFWSTIGLRESALEFWVILVFICLPITLNATGNRAYIYMACYLISIIMVFSSRPQIGWILGLSLSSYLLFRLRQHRKWLLILATVIGIMLGHIATMERDLNTTINFYTEKTIENDLGSTNTTSTSNQKSATEKCRFEGQIVKQENESYKCQLRQEFKSEEELKNPASILFGQSTKLQERQEINSLGAASSIQIPSCPLNSTSTLVKYVCVIYSAPYTVSTFLFRPIIGLDVTSTSSLLASAENLFWSTAIISIVVMYLRNRKLGFFRIIEPSLIFFFIYIFAAASYEGNMGTAFRHKSLILWVVILLIASTIFATKEKNSRDKSQGT